MRGSLPSRPNQRPATSPSLDASQRPGEIRQQHTLSKAYPSHPAEWTPASLNSETPSDSGLDESNDEDNEVSGTSDDDVSMEEEKVTPTATPAMRAKSRNDVTVSDLERLRKLREAVNDQMKLSQERAKVGMPPLRAPSTAGLVARRVSPIKEEVVGSTISPSLEEAFDSSPLPTGLQTASTGSTESAKTIRGSVPPTPSNPAPLRTPSYPFPYVPGTPRMWTSGPGLHKPFTTLSPTVSSMNVREHTPGEGTASEVSTPAASVMTFMPSGASPLRDMDDEQQPAPNLYDLTAELSFEPGLHAWWQTVTKIMNREYGAVRASLAIPADAGELENVPWGQKATYSEFGVPPTNPTNSSTSEHDSPQRTSSDMRTQPSTPGPFRSVPDVESRPSFPRSASSRPNMLSRHSYAGYERERGEVAVPSTPLERPKGPLRTKTHAPHLTARLDPATKPTFALSSYNSGTPGQASGISDLEFSSLGSEAPSGPYTAVLPVLQGLNHEDHALINSTYVNRIISRGKVVTLTREYTPDLPARKDKIPAGASVLKSSIAGAHPVIPRKEPLQAEKPHKKLKLPHDYFARESTLMPFEEFEQFPSSPWAQSPAPSPAIQANPDENPFFTSDNVDESSFQPTPSSPDYAKSRQVEAIGIDRASTVVHIPLIHPLLSQTLPSSRRGGRTEKASDLSADSLDIPRKAPIAILTILSPIVPYPHQLLQSLKLLSLHLATTFGMAQQYSNAQRQASSIIHRRMHSGHKVGFAPFAADREGLEYLLDADIDPPPSSTTASITSPSDYSGRSRASPGGSILGTPGWETSGMIMGRRSAGTTPALGTEMTDSYFDAKQKSPIARSGSSSSLVQMLQSQARDSSPPENRPSSRKGPTTSDARKSSDPKRRGLGQDEKAQGNTSARGNHSAKSSRSHGKTNAPQIYDRSERKQHSYLHSYGADFATSFQMVPSTATATPTGRTPAPPQFTGEDPELQDMLPPSERLLRTIIDALPVQIFTAAPGSGALTWVNSKFVAYRGKDPNAIISEPWQAIHPNDREHYMDQWQQSLSTGQHFAHKVRLQRFDNVFRWFFVRATPLKDKKQAIVHWTGTYMDIHEQHVAEQSAARQAETAASEAKYRALANSSPQVVFAATRSRGVIFCNSQWLTYSGQTEAQAGTLGFMDLVHPDDLAKCRLPVFDEDGCVINEVPTTVPMEVGRQDSNLSWSDDSSEIKTVTSPGATPTAHLPQAKLSSLATEGILKISRDSDGRPSYSTEVRLKNKDGEYRWHLVRVLQSAPVPVNDDEDEEETWYGTCTDINDHKLLEKTLKDTMDAKSRFMSNMSHEIRTPLNGITGMVNFLIDSNLTQEQLEHVHIIRNSTEGLRDLINDILDLSKVEAGMITLQMEWFHVRSLIEEVNDLTSSMAIDKGLELNYLIEDDVPSSVKGDRFRIRQVLLNVVGNAIKFTQEGEIFVRCEVSKDDTAELTEDEATIRFSVSDTGPGFTSEEAEYLFKRFSQLDSSSTKQHGGTGLGLAISKQLVQLHGGDMTARSVAGQGATFLFHSKFLLPTNDDHPPTRVGTPGLLTAAPTPNLPPKPPSSFPPHWSPQLARTDSDNSSMASPMRLHESGASSGSSDPSLRTSIMSTRSSVSSLASISSAPMALQMPSRLRPGRPTSIDEGSTPSSNSSIETIRQRRDSNVSPGGAPLPVMFSILVICPLAYSREAIAKHIDTTIPSNSPHHITTPETLEECKKLLGLTLEGEPVVFTHVVLLLHESPEIVAVANQIFNSSSYQSTSLLIISDFGQRKEIEEQSGDSDYRKLAGSGRLRWVFKPLKPTKFAIIFDPEKSRELSLDRTQDSAAAAVMNQKQIFEELKRRLGEKGIRVLLVEDNRTNQMVLQKFLKKIEINVETVLDGVECTDSVFKHSHDYFSIILCDLHMPNKDGYQTCREIRKWERKNKAKHIPIIALSANVLGDVYSKCADAGFNSYVTKPVDFKELGLAMLKYLDPVNPGKPIEFMLKTKK